MTIVISAKAERDIAHEAFGNRLSVELVLGGRRDVQRMIEAGVKNPPDQTD